LCIAGITSAFGCLGGGASVCCQPSPSMNCGIRQRCPFSQSSYTSSYAFPRFNHRRYGQNSYVPRSQQEPIIAPIGGSHVSSGLGSNSFHQPHHLPHFNSLGGLDLSNPLRSPCSTSQINQVPRTFLNNRYQGHLLDTSYAYTGINDISAASYPIAQSREGGVLPPDAGSFTNVDRLVDLSRVETEIEVRGLPFENHQANEAPKASHGSPPINELAPSQPFSTVLANRTGIVPPALSNVSTAMNGMSSMPRPSLSGSYSTAESTKLSSPSNNPDIAWHTGSKQPQTSMEAVPNEMMQSLYDDISPTVASLSSLVNQRRKSPNGQAKASLQIQQAPSFFYKPIKKLLDDSQVARLWLQ
uniref:Uncharacterized protein n=1 Tax=Parascaris univalens TaxID=6257 RepID=A0A915BV89_PARUN